MWPEIFIIALMQVKFIHWMCRFNKAELDKFWENANEAKKEERFKRMAKQLVWVWVALVLDKLILGYLWLADRIKEDACELFQVMESLKSDRLTIILRPAETFSHRQRHSENRNRYLGIDEMIRLNA